MRKELTDTNTEINQMSELSNENFKATIIKILQQVITKSLEADGKNGNSLKKYKL